MYCVKIELQPTSAMTFRVIPGSNLDIATYPFLPPTTMSGYLRRIAMMAAGEELPKATVETKEEGAHYYALPPHLLTTGAIPIGMKGIHKTHRKGPSNFKHFGFSQIYRKKIDKQENIQLHTWEYFFCESMVGFVLAESSEHLVGFKDCEGWGCKIGKEGYAVVHSVSEPIALQQVRCAATPSPLLSPESIELEDLYQPIEFYGLFNYQWSSKSSNMPGGPASTQPSSIEGYIPLSVGNPVSGATFTLDYLHDGEDIFIALSWIQALQRGLPKK